MTKSKVGRNIWSQFFCVGFWRYNKSSLLKQCFFCHWLARLLLFLKIFHMKASLWSKVGYLEVNSGCRLRSLYHQNQVLEYPQPPLCPCVSTYTRTKSVLLLSTDWLLKCTRRNEKVICVNLGPNKMGDPGVSCHGRCHMSASHDCFETEKCQSARVQMHDPSLWAQVHTPRKQLQTSSICIGSRQPATLDTTVTSSFQPNPITIAVKEYGFALPADDGKKFTQYTQKVAKLGFYSFFWH